MQLRDREKGKGGGPEREMAVRRHWAGGGKRPKRAAEMGLAYTERGDA